MNILITDQLVYQPHWHSCEAEAEDDNNVMHEVRPTYYY